MGFFLKSVNDKLQRSTSLIHTFIAAEQNRGVVKNEAAGSHKIGLKAGLDWVLPDAVEKILADGLKLVEIMMALVFPVDHSVFPWLENQKENRTFAAFASGEEDFSGDTSVEIKTDMRFGLFCPIELNGFLHLEKSWGMFFKGACKGELWWL